MLSRPSMLLCCTGLLTLSACGGGGTSEPAAQATTAALPAVQATSSSQSPVAASTGSNLLLSTVASTPSVTTASNLSDAVAAASSVLESGPAPTMALQASNMAMAADVAGKLVKVAGGLGAWAMDELQTLSNLGTSGRQVVCTGGGQLRYTLRDLDSDAALSVQDEVVATFSQCYLPALQRAVDGEITLKFLTLERQGSSSQSKIHVDFSRGLNVPDFLSLANGVTLRSLMLGSFLIEQQSNPQASTILLSSTPADDLRVDVTMTPPGVVFTEAIKGLALSRKVDHVARSVVITPALRYQSSLLMGSLHVLPGTGMRADQATYPTSGQWQVKGSGGSVVTLSPAPSAGSGQLKAELDTTGDGVPERSLLVPTTGSERLWSAS